MTQVERPPVAVIMGSRSDWPVMKAACGVLDELGLGYWRGVVSAHRTPDRLYTFAKTAHERGYKVIIAGAGGAAHLPGMTAALTYLPVIGVPVESKTFKGMDSLLSIVQMPPGVPVATMAVNGAKNAGLLAAAVLAVSDSDIASRLIAWRAAQTASVLETVED